MDNMTLNTPRAHCDEDHPHPHSGGRLEERLLKNRTILLFGEISQDSARDFCQKLLLLAHEGEDPITVIINSQGGHVEAGDSIFDIIRFITPRVRIVGSGWVASAGALIYCSVPKEDRFSLPNTRFMLHQPSGGAGGQASDVHIEAKEIIKMRSRLNAIIAEACGQPVEKVQQDSDRNFWMSPEEAQEYGLVGQIISTMSELK